MEFSLTASNIIGFGLDVFLPFCTVFCLVFFFFCKVFQNVKNIVFLMKATIFHLSIVHTTGF